MRTFYFINDKDGKDNNDDQYTFYCRNNHML
jgi:hypothetical protein